MRILAIRGCNIASLAAPFEVDLAHGLLGQCNLFAIAGPTGAGKSSLLDALCLALYDQTPRLQGASQQGARLPDADDDGLSPVDSRQLLRRGAAQGFAEVDFIGLDRQAWRARWQVRRARGNSAGRLQKVVMSLHALPELNPAPGVATNSEVKARIEQLIGLDYRQFTHAVLLAQNEFAALLRASDDERARLLQALTGSERFERLSIAAFERTRAERETLERLSAELAATQALDPEARSELEQSCAQAEQHCSGLRRQQLQLQRWADWLHERARCQAALQQAEQDLHAAQQQWADAAALRRQHQRLQLLQPCHGLWQHCEEATQAQAGREAALRQAASALQQASQQAAQAQADLHQASSSQQQLLQQIEQMQPELAQARALDQQLGQLEQALQQAAATLDQRRQQAEQSTATACELQQRRQQLQQAQAQLEESLRAQASDRLLLDGARWREDLQALGVLRQQALGLTGQRGQVGDEVLRLQAQGQTLRAALEQDESALQLARAALAERQQALAAQPAEQLQQQREALQQAQQRLAQQREFVSARQRLQQAADSAAQQLEQLRSQIAANAAALPAAEQAEAAAEAAHRQAQRALLAAHAAAGASASELRERLLPDQPCPVCGSSSHPWADSEALLRDLGAASTLAADADARPPQQATDGLQRLVAQLAQQQTDCEQALAECRARSTRLRTRLEADRDRLVEVEQGALQALQARTALLQQASAEPATRDWVGLDQAAATDALARAQAELQQQADQLRQQEQAQLALQQAVEQAREELDRTMSEQQQRQQALAQLERDSQQAQLELTALDARLESLQAQQGEAAERLSGWLSKLGLPLPSGTLDGLQTQLQQRAEDLAQRLQQQQTQAEALQLLAEQLTPATAAAASAEAAATAAADRVAALQSEFAAARQQRRQRLQDQPVAEVEAGLRQRRLDGEAQLQQAQTRQREAELALAAARSRQDTDQRELEQAQARAAQCQQQRAHAWADIASAWAELSDVDPEVAGALLEHAPSTQADGVVATNAGEAPLLPAREAALACLKADLAALPAGLAPLQARLDAMQQQLTAAGARCHTLKQALHEQGQRRPESWPLPAAAVAYANDLPAVDGPDDGMPDEVRPDEHRPDEARPDEARPDEARPDEAGPDLDALDTEQVSAALLSCAAALEQAERALGQLLAQRLQDDQARARAGELSNQVQAQRQRHAHWHQLNALIGSADGRKFRNIAQRDSLRLLLGQGNLQLRRLGLRYSLRAMDEGLGLLLVDHEAGDELRLVHSLSGGESFLVSLALALALASLSSHNLPIESLFIDEGFGQLDQATLEATLGVLDRLQDQGRKVGVISHLRELTERIEVRVEVIPERPGQSRIEVRQGAAP